MTTTTKDDYRIKQQHILYGDMSDESLKELIKDTATMRKHPNAGGDLQEMRNEYRRRVADRFARRPKSTYNNNTMLEKPADVPKFKKTKFVTGMAPRQEKFCMEYMATGDAAKAYLSAGYKAGGNNSDTTNRAYAVLNKPKIKQRIDNIRQEAIKHMAWNADRVMDRLNEVYEHALGGGDYTTANRSIESVAKHLGMFIDRSENVNKTTISHLESGDDDDSIDNDIKRLAEIAGFKVIEGGKKREE